MINVSGPVFALFVIVVCLLLIPLLIWAAADLTRRFEHQVTSMSGGPGRLQAQPKKVRGPESRG
jgi:hypothetical protein